MDVVLVLLKHESDIMIIESAIVGATYGSMGAIPYYNSLKHSNPAKYNWMVAAGLIVAAPVLTHVVKKNSSKKQTQLSLALGKTARAGATAFYISQLDGPLPIADVLALTYFTASAGLSWFEFFDE